MDNVTLRGDSSNRIVVLIADVVFYRNNRSTFAQSELDIFELMHVQTQNTDIWKRVLINLPHLALYILSILLNSILLLMSIKKPHKDRWMRLPLLIAILAFCNIILATGFFAYTLLIDVFYSVPSIDSINIDAWPLADFCYAAVKETLKHQIVHNLVNAQAIFILLITIDRYYSLFTTYDPNIRSSWGPTLLAILPYVLVGVFLDFRLQSAISGATVALFIW
ncbi:hypothetical protein Tcan_03036 [Toxocara canis]|uniref:G_PROTEIN_RECEP_F1_2 domain-containing protein n=1 Tax=Toxocara canis TaxID=6265 RepID=A0A0B2VZ39_TOXCA|nr:hypothetical protein Tcan_03036 [Toxocara canis]